MSFCAMGPLIPLLWISGGIYPGFQSQVDFLLTRFLACLLFVRFTSGATPANLLMAIVVAGHAPYTRSSLNRPFFPKQTFHPFNIESFSCLLQHRCRTIRQSFFSVKANFESFMSHLNWFVPLHKSKWFVLLIFWEESCPLCYAFWQIVLSTFYRTGR